MKAQEAKGLNVDLQKLADHKDVKTALGYGKAG